MRTTKPTLKAICIILVLSFVSVTVDSSACQTSDTTKSVVVDFWEHPDGASTGLMPVFSLYDSSDNRYQITTQLDGDYMFIQKIGGDNSVSLSMKYGVRTTMNEAVITSDDANIRMLVSKLYEDEPILLEIDTSDLTVSNAYIQPNTQIDTGSVRRNHFVCSPSTEDICFFNIFDAELTSEFVCKVDFGSMSAWECNDVSDSNEIAIAGLGAISDTKVVVLDFTKNSLPAFDYHIYAIDFSDDSISWSFSQAAPETYLTSDSLFDTYSKGDVHINSDQSEAIITAGGQTGTYVLVIDPSDGTTINNYHISVSDYSSYSQYTSALMSDTMLTIFAMNGATDKVGYTHMVDMSDWSVTSYKSGTNLPPVFVSSPNSLGEVNYLGFDLENDELISILVNQDYSRYAGEFFMTTETTSIDEIDSGLFAFSSYTQNIDNALDQTAISTTVSASSYSLNANSDNSYEVTANVWFDESDDLIVAETGSTQNFGPIEFSCLETVTSASTFTVDHEITDSDGNSLESWISISDSSGMITYDGSETYHGTIKVTSTYTYPSTSFTLENDIYFYAFFAGETTSSDDDDDDYCLSTETSASCGFYIFVIVALIIAVFVLIILAVLVFLKRKSIAADRRENIYKEKGSN